MGRIRQIGIANGTSGSEDFTLDNYLAPEMNCANKKILENSPTFKLDINEKSSRINIDKQNRHVEGTKEYTEGRSIITVSMAKCQEIVDKFKGTGRINSDNNESVDTGEVVGFYVNKETGEKIPTTIVSIRYSKTGAHIVPARPKKRKDE